MRRLATFALLLATVAGSAGRPAARPPPPAPAAEPAESARDSGTPKALLFKPDGAGPFPVVVGLHSCAGLYDRGGAIAARYRDWAQHLMKAGFAVLYPDSYGSRGLGSQCAVRHGPVRTSREQVADANAARRWLQTQGFVQPGRVTLLGWS